MYPLSIHGLLGVHRSFSYDRDCCEIVETLVCTYRFVTTMTVLSFALVLLQRGCRHGSLSFERIRKFRLYLTIDNKVMR